jgi:hypothetical protein
MQQHPYSCSCSFSLISSVLAAFSFLFYLLMSCPVLCYCHCHLIAGALFFTHAYHPAAQVLYTTALIIWTADPSRKKYDFTRFFLFPSSSTLLTPLHYSSPLSLLCSADPEAAVHRPERPSAQRVLDVAGAHTAALGTQGRALQGRCPQRVAGMVLYVRVTVRCFMP